LPAVNGEFVWRMEEVLKRYAQPLDPKRPLVCFDEASKELRADVRPELPVAPGQPARQDCEYQRQGTANMFMHVCPLLGWRHVEVTAQRCYRDFALQMQALVDVHFPDAEMITVVLDNLNTHSKGALYETFPPEEAQRIAERLEFVYTPKHASWLNMAEMEWSILVRQCLDRRIADAVTLQHEIAAWQEPRNAQRLTIDWGFRVADARVKLEHLYPCKTSVTNH
jgi:transposase